MLFRIAENKDPTYSLDVSFDYGVFNLYAYALGNIEDKIYDSDRQCWKIKPEDLKTLREYEKHDHSDLLIGNYSYDPEKIENWAPVGDSLKLVPYSYQRQIMKYIIDHEKVLVTVPCGSGKTMILLGVYDYLRRQRVINGPMIVIVRASLKEQWIREVSKFTDYKAVSIKTFSQLNKDQQKFEDQFKDYDIYICNYESLLNEDIKRRLLKIGAEIMGADECQAVKDDTTKRSKAIKAFNKIRFTIGMTATPVQKNPMDLFSIFKFVNPKIFPKKGEFGDHYVRWQSFGQWIKKPVGSKNEAELRDKLKNNMIIRSKTDISSQLPTLVIMKKYCVFSHRQQKKAELLQKKLEELHELEQQEMTRLAKAGAETSSQLKQIGSEILMFQTFAQEFAVDERLLEQSDANNTKMYLTGDYSPKTELCLSLIREIIEAEEKVAIFSRFAKYQQILKSEIYSEFKGVNVAQINGSMSSEKRQRQLDLFKTDDSCKILLMSGAANEGINLSNCAYLIEMELAQSYAEQTQRHGRIERADSTHNTVYVYQLIVEDSYDMIAEKIIDKKEGYDRTIIKGELEEA